MNIKNKRYYKITGMYGLKELLNSMQSSYHNHVKNLNEKVSNINFLPYIVQYSRFVCGVNKFCRSVYDSNLVVKSAVDHVLYFIEKVYSLAIGKKIEPMDSYWISSSFLLKRDKRRYFGDEYALTEFYEFVKNPTAITDNASNAEVTYNEICDAVDSIVLNTQLYVEGMVKMKYGDSYVYRIFDNNLGHFTDLKMPLMPSKGRLLSVEYTHPIMSKGIPIVLDNSVYYADNQLLSPAFIKLYLEHQPELYHFDMDYVLKIIDNDINSFELKFNKSVLLTEDGYKIV
jgi:hypothetical protein